MYRLTDKFGTTIGFINEVDFSFIGFLLLPFAPIILLGVLGGIFWLSFSLVSFLLPTLAGFGNGDTLSFEVAGLCIATILAWLVAYLIIVFSKKDNLDVMTSFSVAIIPIGTYVFTIISLIYVDITYNNALGNIFRIIWFIGAIILHMIIMFFWTLATSIVGIILVLIFGFLTRWLKDSIIYQIKMRGKRKGINNSEYIKKLYNELDKRKVRSIIIKCDNLILEEIDKKKNDLSFVKDGYSALDYYGKLAMASLIYKKYKYLRITKYDNDVVLDNKELIKKEQYEKVLKDKENMKKEKHMKKENLKNGKNW